MQHESPEPFGASTGGYRSRSHRIDIGELNALIVSIARTEERMASIATQLVSQSEQISNLTSEIYGREGLLIRVSRNMILVGTLTSVFNIVACVVFTSVVNRFFS